MADISKLSRLINGLHRDVDLATNDLVVAGLKVSDDGGSTSTQLTKTILDNLLALQDGSDFSDGTNAHTHDGRYYTETELGSNANGEGASLIGIEDANTQFTATDVEGALDEAIDAAQAAQADIDGHLDGGANKHDASEIDVETAGNFTTVADLETNLGAIDGAFGGNLANSPTNYTQGANTVAGHLSGIDTTLGNLSSTINNFEWQESALDYIVDNTAVPPTEVSGDRYILSHDGGAPNAAWDGASAGDIVEFNGTTWDATTPTTGMFVAADDEPDALYLWGGSSWSSKAFESTTASDGLTKVGFDIRIASQGVTAAKLGGDVAGTGLTGGSGTAIAIDFGTSGQQAVSAADLASTNNGLGASLIGVEDTAGNFTATDVEAALAELYAALEAQNEASEISYSNATSGLTATDVQAAIDEVEGRVDTLEATSSADALTEDIDAGESYAATTLFAVRYAKAADAGFVAGRVYKADKDASSSDDFYAIGLVYPGGAVSAGSPITVTKSGRMTVTGHGFTAGAPLFLDAAGAITETAPSTADEAVVRVGIARDANTLEVQVGVVGVN